MLVLVVKPGITGEQRSDVVGYLQKQTKLQIANHDGLWWSNFSQAEITRARVGKIHDKVTDRGVGVRKVTTMMELIAGGKLRWLSHPAS